MKKIFFVLLILFANNVFSQELVLNCEFTLLVKQPDDNFYEQLDNSIILITIKNNNEIYLNNITANQKDNTPYIIHTNNNDYIFATLDFYLEENTDNQIMEWIETLTIRKKDNFVTIYHQSIYGLSTKYAFCIKN